MELYRQFQSHGNQSSFDIRTKCSKRINVLIFVFKGIEIEIQYQTYYSVSAVYRDQSISIGYNVRLGNLNLRTI